MIYRVYGKVIQHSFVDVEADNEEDAKKKAALLGQEKFVDLGFEEFVIDKAHKFDIREMYLPTTEKDQDE